MFSTGSSVDIAAVALYLVQHGLAPLALLLLAISYLTVHHG
jgi:hypothetical protein